jgi:hypothetical protein
MTQRFNTSCALDPARILALATANVDIDQRALILEALKKALVHLAGRTREKAKGNSKSKANAYLEAHLPCTMFDKTI